MHQQHTPWGSANSQERTHLVLLTARFLLEHVCSFPKGWNNLSSGSLHVLHGNTWIFTNVNLYCKFPPRCSTGVSHSGWPRKHWASPLQVPVSKVSQEERLLNFLPAFPHSPFSITWLTISSFQTV